MLRRLTLMVPILALAGCVSAYEPSASVEAMEGAEELPPPAPAAAPTAPASQTPAPTEDKPAAVAAAKPAPRKRAPAAPAAPSTPEPPIPEDLLSKPAEEVIITPSSLTGYWRLIASHMIDVDVGLFSGVHIKYGGEMRDRNICWLQQSGRKLTALCSSGGALKNAEGSVDEDGVSMRWWSGPATINFSGKLTDQSRITGGFSGGALGISITGNIPASLSRMETPTQEADPETPTAKMLQAVWADMKAGHLSEGRVEGVGLKRVMAGLSAEAARDLPQHLVYLGNILQRWRKEQREFVEDVYQVQTKSGRHLCRIALGDTGQVADFNCVAMGP